MPWYPRIGNFDAQHGAVGDLPVQAVPPHVMTDIRNMRFLDGRVEKCEGMENTLGTPPIAPYYSITAKDNAGEAHLFLAGLAKIYELASGSYTDVTRTVGGDYAATGENDWTGTVLHGIAVLNNPNDTPQSWDVSSGKFIALPNWPAGYKCGALRSFENYLLALNVYDGATQYPHNVLWSHPADPGSVPASWDVTDATKDAGESPISKTPGFLVDGFPLGNLMVLYKETSAHIMQFVGAPWIFKFAYSTQDVGVMAKNCVATFKGRHLVLTQDDVVLFDGRNVESIMERRWRRDLFNSVNASDSAKSFVVALPHLKEYWICISTTPGYPPDLAYIWRPDNNSWSKRDLPFVQAISYDFAPEPADDSWDADAGTWDSDLTAWSLFEQSNRIAVAASPTNVELFTLQVGNTVNGELITAFAEHRSFDFAHDKVPDSSVRIKHLSKLRPRFIAEAGVQIKVRVGVQKEIDDDITWSEEQIYTVGTTNELCWAVNGRYISWKFLSDTDVAWSLEAIDFLVEYGGYY